MWDTNVEGLDVYRKDEVLRAREPEVLEEEEGVGGVPAVGGEYLDRGGKKQSRGGAMVEGWPNQSASTNTRICLTELVFTLNNFSFNSSHFLQTKWGDHEHLHGPSYASLF
eukprot:g24844.t1